MKRHKSNYKAIVLLLTIYKPQCFKYYKNLIFSLSIFAKRNTRKGCQKSDTIRSKTFDDFLMCRVMNNFRHFDTTLIALDSFNSFHTQKIFSHPKIVLTFLHNVCKGKINDEIWVRKRQLIIALIKNKSSKIWRLKFAEAYFHATVNNNNKRGCDKKDFKHRKNYFRFKKLEGENDKNTEKQLDNKNINSKFNLRE